MKPAIEALRSHPQGDPLRTDPEDCRSTANLPADATGPFSDELHTAVNHREVVYELAKLIGRQIARDLMNDSENASHGEEKVR